MLAANKQIGLNEMRHLFRLKPQGLRFDCSTKEESEIQNSDFEYQKSLQYFHNEVLALSRATFRFRPDELDSAENVLDRKIPEIRQLFRLEYQELKDISFTVANIDRSFYTFEQLISKLVDILGEVVNKSGRAIHSVC